MLQVNGNFIHSRLDRNRHWGLFSFWFGVWLFAAYFFPFLSARSSVVKGYVYGSLEALLICIAIISLITNLNRRMHDLNLKGSPIVLLNPAFIFLAFVKRGSAGINNYGPPPPSANALHYLLIAVAPVVFYLLQAYGVPT